MEKQKKVEKEGKKYNFKGLKIFILIVLILLIIVLVYFFRNSIILSTLSGKNYKNSCLTNYTITEIKVNEGKDYCIIKSYNLDGKQLVNIEYADENSSIKNMYLVKTVNGFVMFSEVNGKKVAKVLNQNQVSIEGVTNFLDVCTGKNGYNSMCSFIKKVKVDDVPCYEISGKNSNIIEKTPSENSKVYVEIATGLVKKIVYNDENDKSKVYEIKYDYTFDDVNEDDLKGPDISNYTVVKR